MSLRIGILLCLALAMTASAVAQSNPLRDAGSTDIAAQPDQPVQPRVPTLVPRARPPLEKPLDAPQPPKPPFTLAAGEQAKLDEALKLWEQRNRTVKTFDCRFTRWTYDVVFSTAEKPKFIDVGVIKYASPDRGMFRIDTTQRDGKEVAIEPTRAEHWISDGKSITEFNYTKRQMIVHQLPKELQGKAIADSPLPFLFGADAAKLKQRYFLRVRTPPDVRDQVWLEAYPKYQQDAANFHHALFIVTSQGMAPFALKLVQPNEKDFTSYQFFEIVVNDPLRLFKGDPFRATQPSGWQTVYEPAPQSAAQAGRVPPPSR